MLNVLTVLSMLALEASAFWRLPCRQSLTIERIDPLTHFGGVGQHVHTIHGGNKFSQSVTNAELLTSTCTSCQVKQDLSVYWTPVMYFQDASGNFSIVSQTGGMLVYYLPRGDNVKAFPPGFRMIAGDPNLRNFPYPIVEKSLWQDSDRTEDALRQKAVGFNCLNYNEPANAALGLRNITSIPDMATTCADGLRAEVFFPSCWNGKDLDSTNHRDHMRYPSLMDDGTCPEGFEERLVSLFFETIWNVAAFKGQEGQFVFSTGDPTGDGYHGDFLNAWDVDVLQTAIDTCTSLSGIVEECEIFEQQTLAEMQACTLEPAFVEDVVGPLKELPGCNDIQPGPAYATEGGCSSDPKPTASSKTSTPTSTATESSSHSSTPDADQKDSSDSGSDSGSDPSSDFGSDSGYPVGYANVAIQDESIESSTTTSTSVDPNVVIVTVTTYTTAPATTVTVTARSESTPLAKRHAHHRRRAMHHKF